MFPHCQVVIRGSLCLKSAVAEKPLSHDVGRSVTITDMKRTGVVYLMGLVKRKVCPVCVNLKLHCGLRSFKMSPHIGFHMTSC